MVLVEAMASGTTVVASASGAIPEVAGAAAELFPAGDWMELARRLESGPLDREPAARRDVDPEALACFSTEAAAERLRAAYARVA